MRPLRFPTEIQQHLPPDKLCVHEFIGLDLPPCAPQLAQVQKYTSELPPTVDDVHEIMSLHSPPDDILKTLQQSIRAGLVKSIQCPHWHSPPAGGQRYPLWLAAFWVQLSSVRKIQESWRTAVRNLEAQVNQDKESVPLRQAFNALSHIPWTGQLQGFRDTIELHKLSIYFTRGWLTDNHELVMLSALKDDLLAAKKTDSFIENTAFMLLLGNAHRDRERYTTERCYEWLCQRGDDLAIGDKRYLTTIANQDGVHWVAIILDFDQQRLFHGDPFGTRISAEYRTIIDWWTQHHVGVCFTLHELPTGRQLDNFSCGILTWGCLRLFYGL
jgi:hypothetical protein